MTAPEEVSVELEEHGAVVPGGVRTTSWQVRQGDVWMHVAEARGAQVTLDDAGPGTIWTRRIGLMLVPGTLLERIVSEPEARVASDAMAYLSAERTRPRRRVRRTRYRVSRRGALIEERAKPPHA